MTSNDEKSDYLTVNRCQTVASVLWPSFLIAGVCNSLFWVFVDPHDFGMITGLPELSRIGAYSSGFLLMWAMTALSSYLSMRFCKPCAELNRLKKQN